jgi:hypothetical protein
MSPCVPTVRGHRRALPILLAILFGLYLAPALHVWALDVPDVVATVQGQPIAAADLTASVKSELLRLDMPRYQILKNGLDQLIAEQLTKLEAAKRQQSPEQLLQEEVTAKVPPVTPEQVKAFYESNKQRINQPFDQIQPRIEAYLNRPLGEARNVFPVVGVHRASPFHFVENHVLPRRRAAAQHRRKIAAGRLGLRGHFRAKPQVIEQ